ncbi:hypothetical protein J6590_016547 [Homalodisca vitripennis]|nr:hypothetical protein J6590_016547 [Homalodisca vitripennis]
MDCLCCQKLAKKKEEYLARYKHLDLGHRLGEQYQHDPAGHAPSVEEIRQRQQEQLRLDALLNQHRDDELVYRTRGLEIRAVRTKISSLPPLNLACLFIAAGVETDHVERGLSRRDSGSAPATIRLFSCELL